MGFKHKPVLITVSNCHFSQIKFYLLIDQFCVLGDILPDSFCLETTTENLVKGKNVKRFRGQLNQQSNRKWSVRPGKLSLFLPLLQRFLSPKEEDFFSLWGRISCNLAFPTTTEGSGFNEKSKDQMLQAVVQSSSPAHLIGTSERNFMFKSKFGDFPTVSCRRRHSYPLIYNTTPLKVKP